MLEHVVKAQRDTGQWLYQSATAHYVPTFPPQVKRPTVPFNLSNAGNGASGNAMKKAGKIGHKGNAVRKNIAP
jgi:hypothetical protein